MKAVSGRHLARLIEAHGWVFQRVKGSHHVYSREGNRENVSIPIHGNRDLGTGIQARLMKLAGLTEDDL